MSTYLHHRVARVAICAVAIGVMAFSGARRTARAGEAAPTGAMVPPGYSLSHTGDMHDFDFFAGAWMTTQRRLRARGVGSSDWETFSAVQCLTPYLGGLATVDELYIPSKQRAGLTLRTFNVEKHQWLIYWVSSATGQLDPVPVVGGFERQHGEFYAEDQEDGRPIKVRYSWNKLDNDHARWEQAFSYDNKVWETNWTADFVRADAAKLCENGKPKR